jgi:DNA replication protein DnaC
MATQRKKKKKRGGDPVPVAQSVAAAAAIVTSAAIAATKRPAVPEPTYACAECDDTGWKKIDYLTVTACKCQAETKRRARLARLGIPKRYAECTIDSLFDRGNAELIAAKRRAQEFVDCWPSPASTRPGMLFAGTPGVGKTHLAVAVLRGIVDADKQGTLLFVNFNDFAERIKSTFDEKSDERTQEVLRPAYTADLLALDELGGTRPTAWVQDVLYNLINDRYNNDRPVVFTTNFTDTPGPAGTLADRIGDRLRSRIFEMCEIIAFRSVADFRAEGARRI